MSEMPDQPLAAATSVSGPAFSVEDFRGTRKLTRWLKAMLWISLAGDVATSGVYGALSWGGLKITGLVFIFGRGLLETIIWAQAGFTIVLYLVFFYWTYRANQNSHRLGADGMRFSPGWSVGWYFVPFLNLWKPYQAMREIWQTSANPAQWQDQRPGTALILWWILNLVSLCVAGAGALYDVAADQTTASDELFFDALGAAFSAAGTYFAIKIVGQISDAQANRARERAFE